MKLTDLARTNDQLKGYETRRRDQAVLGFSEGLVFTDLLLILLSAPP